MVSELLSPGPGGNAVFGAEDPKGVITELKKMHLDTFEV